MHNTIGDITITDSSIGAFAAPGGSIGTATNLSLPLPCSSNEGLCKWMHTLIYGYTVEYSDKDIEDRRERERERFTAKKAIFKYLFAFFKYAVEAKLLSAFHVENPPSPAAADAPEGFKLSHKKRYESPSPTSPTTALGQPKKVLGECVNFLLIRFLCDLFYLFFPF